METAKVFYCQSKYNYKEKLAKAMENNRTDLINKYISTGKVIIGECEIVRDSCGNFGYGVPK